MHAIRDTRPSLPEFLTRREVLQALRISDTTFRRMLADGRFVSPLMVRGSMRFDAAAVRAWMQSPATGNPGENSNG